MKDEPISCTVNAEPVDAAGPLSRVAATSAARAFIAEIVAECGPVMFHQSGGCCDGSSPMCYRRGEFLVGASDILLGAVDGAEVWISGPQFEAWKHTQLVLDVVPGRGGMFSLDNGRERRFLSRARAFSPEELALLADA